MVKVNVSRTRFSLSIAISVALTPNLRKLNFSQISQRMSESFEYVGPGTQKHLSSTYLSAVHVTAVKTTYLVESAYSKLRLS